MWYTVLLSLVVDVGGLILVYVLLRDRVRRAVAAETRIGEVRDEVSRLLVELNQATDRNIALMEDRIGILNDAIATADKKIGLLRRETEKHDVGSQIYSRLAEGRPLRAPAAPEAPSDASPPARMPRPAPAAPKAAPAPLSVELSEKPGSGAVPSGPDVRQRVMMLFRSGFSPSLIASRVGAPLGEVELIISLEQRKGQA
ncbi:MAG TPA: hypothetical protein VFI08_12635 [Spirochaetia bacterium]|nr:hypothetical protein [Spirochaetia bacterium]